MINEIQEVLKKSTHGVKGVNPLTLKNYEQKIVEMYEDKQLTEKNLYQTMILKANENLNPDDIEPGWSEISANILLQQTYKEIFERRNIEVYQGEHFYSLIKKLTKIGIYKDDILNTYTKEELIYFGNTIDFNYDIGFNYVGLKLLKERYLARTFGGEVLELPQERWMVISLALNVLEKNKSNCVKDSYWVLQNRFMTVATPTLSNAGKSSGQLASCFIDAVEDSLNGIYMNNWDSALLSKGGGGISVYFGKLRGKNSDIQNFKGIASGILPWAKQLDNTAKSVDQLGQRQGAIVVYNDVWHNGISKFLDTKLNNGDESEKLHTLSLGVCIPDIFIRKVIKKEDFYLFDPYEVKKKMNFSLEDYYDEEKYKTGETLDIEKHAFSYRYEMCMNNPKLTKVKINARELMGKIVKVQKETGYPFMFYRDTANRMNPNKHSKNSMIYCSNLCTEIMQNVAPTILKKRYVEDKDGVMILHTETIMNDYVVCNLSSLHLPNAVQSGFLQKIIRIQVRMLDNVVDLNQERLEVLQARETTKKYRAIGAGTFGWHHLLALKGIDWESQESVDYCDELYEEIAFYTIQASMELAKEKGSYPMFKNSEWHTGLYFERRNYSTANSRFDWDQLKADVQKFGIRNGHLMAVAPNSGTAKILFSTDGIDPTFAAVYADEQKRSKDVNVVPDLNLKTIKLYKSAFNIDQKWSIEQNAKRARHIDQGISFNIYLGADATASEIMKYHLQIWNLGIKTSYYVRSTTTKIKECTSCAS